MRISFIRHPQTEWNVQGLLQGKMEGPITEEGETSAITLVQNFENSFDYLFSADNQRCLYLANLFSIRFGKSINIDERLNERSFGIFEGMRTDAIAKKVGWQDLSAKQKFLRKPDGGESLADVTKKIDSFLYDLTQASKYKDKTILCISSGGSIKAAIFAMHLIPMPTIFEMKINNLEKLTFTLRSDGYWIKSDL